MQFYELDHPFQDVQKEFLIKVAKETRKNKSTVFEYSAYVDSISIEVGSNKWNVDYSIMGAVDVFEYLGYINLIKEGRTTKKYTITNLGFKWVDYQLKNPIQKWFVRHPAILKNILAGLVVFLTVTLTILQIAQIANPNFMGLLRKFLGL